MNASPPGWGAKCQSELDGSVDKDVLKKTLWFGCGSQMVK